MANYRLFNELTREDARALAASATIVLPVGATEQHGPHLPVGTDSFAVEHIVRAAADRVGDQVPLVVAPTLPFGCSPHHLPFGGTMSISSETYLHVVTDLMESLVIGGWTRLAIINGHGGNHELVQLVIRDLALKHPVSGLACSYWLPAWDALLAEEAHQDGRVPGHAGAFETSLVMALRPELVKEPRPHRDGNHAVSPASGFSLSRQERHGSWQEIDGYSDSPDLATAEKGERYLAAVAGAIGAMLVEFHLESGGARA